MSGEVEELTQTGSLVDTDRRHEPVRHPVEREGIAGRQQLVAQRPQEQLLTLHSAEVTAPVLVFISAYQIPMYLTPMVMRGVHQGRQ